MPLQPSSYRLLLPLLKSMHVLRQKKVVRQTLGNTTPFTFLPHPYTSTRGEWLAVQLKLRLPCLRCLGRGCHAHPDLSLWLLYDNAPKWLRGNLGYNISQTGRSMLGNTLPLSGFFWSGEEVGGGGGVWPRPWGGCYCVVCLAPGTKRSMVMVIWVTMSPLRSDSVLERLVISTITCSVTHIGALGSTGSSGWAGSS